MLSTLAARVVLHLIAQWAARFSFVFCGCGERNREWFSLVLECNLNVHV